MSSLYDILEFERLLGFLLVLFRILGVLLVAPILGNRSIPPIFMICFSLILTLMLFPIVPIDSVLGVNSELLILKLVLQEVTIGVLIGFAAAVVFAAVQSAGELFGIKLGFSIAQIIDPSNMGSASILGSFYVIIGALMFLYLNGHHSIIQATVESFNILPLGQGFQAASGFTVADLVVKLVVVAVKMAAPILIVLTLLALIFGFITKMSPQMNIYFNVGFVLGPVIGMITMILTLPLFRMLMTNLTGELEGDLVQVLRALKGV